LPTSVHTTPFPAAARKATVGSAIGVALDVGTAVGLAVAAGVDVAFAVGVTEVALLGEALGDDAAGVHAVSATSETIRKSVLIRTASHWMSLPRVRGVTRERVRAR